MKNRKIILTVLILGLIVNNLYPQAFSPTNISMHLRSDSRGIFDEYFALNDNLQSLSIGSRSIARGGDSSFSYDISSQRGKMIIAKMDEIDIDEAGAGVKDIDGNFYPSVIIGNQEWMAENLRVTRDANGNDITRYCYYNDAANCDLYGGLYTWNTAMNGATSTNTNPSNVQGICPTGWHLPSDAEWSELIDYLVEQGYPDRVYDPNGTGNALKSCRQVSSPLGSDCDTSEHPRWNAHSTHFGKDVFGFSALPGGSRHYDGSFYGAYEFGAWWSSTEYDLSEALYRDMGTVGGSIAHGNDNKRKSISIRCLKD